MPLESVASRPFAFSPVTQNATSTYQVKPGDTLSAIARRNGTSISALLEANPKIKDPSLLYAGDTIELPSRTQPGVAATKPAVQAAEQVATTPAQFTTGFETPPENPVELSPGDVSTNATNAPVDLARTAPSRPSTTSPVATPAVARPSEAAAKPTRVNAGHAWLEKLATGRLSNGPTSTCVATTLRNMDRLGVPNFAGGTAADPNNARGAMVQLLQTGKWSSLPLPGSQERTIKSPYGTVKAQVLNADAYEAMAKRGEIPSGSILFQTRHGWSANSTAKGNDMGIVRDGGRVTHNYKPMSPIIYGNAKEVVVLVPSAALAK